MMTKTHKNVPLSQIAAFLNDHSGNSDVLVFDGCLETSELADASFRIDALMFLICTGGTASISIDLQQFDIVADTLVIINPKNYVCIRDCSDDFTCRMIVCSFKTIENILPKLSDLLPVIVSGNRTPVFSLQPSQAKWLKDSFALIKDNVDAGPSKFQMPTIHGIMQAAFYYVMDIIISRNPPQKEMSSRKEELMVKFIIAVLHDFKKERKVEYYADKLCITSKHLSAVVKELSGVTAGKIIDDQVILEAKILLRTTDLTIQEIASRLNFPNQSFFGKYFKHSTGLAPSEYRLSQS